MSVNLNDWFGDHLWAWWLAAAVLVVAAGLTFRSRVALGVAVGPLMAVAVAFVRPDSFGLQAALALVGGVLGWIIVRRTGWDQVDE